MKVASGILWGVVLYDATCAITLPRFPNWESMCDKLSSLNKHDGCFGMGSLFERDIEYAMFKCSHMATTFWNYQEIDSPFQQECATWTSILSFLDAKGWSILLRNCNATNPDLTRLRSKAKLCRESFRTKRLLPGVRLFWKNTLCAHIRTVQDDCFRVDLDTNCTYYRNLFMSRSYLHPADQECSSWTALFFLLSDSAHDIIASICGSKLSTLYQKRASCLSFF